MFLSKVSIDPCIIILYIIEKIFWRYCLQVFTTKEMLKCHTKDCFKSNSKQRITMLEKDYMLNTRKI